MNCVSSLSVSARPRVIGVHMFGPSVAVSENAARRTMDYLIDLGIDDLVVVDRRHDQNGLDERPDTHGQHNWNDRNDLHGYHDLYGRHDRDEENDLDNLADRHEITESVTVLRLSDTAAARWTPDHDTTGLGTVLEARFKDHERNLEREIVLAMLASPVPFRYPTHDEFISAVRIRLNIVRAAGRAELAFDIQHAERPEDYWTYDEARGFALLPGKSLIEGLTKAMQPQASGKLYSFSCYRATEYVTLLGIAQELTVSNPSLLAQLQGHWENCAIMSGLFHDVFLREYGSMEEPLPPKFYVPGDRLWFRNPDEYSSNVEGFEGSWVFYLGGGMFNNFWKHEQPFSLTSKCVEIYHWRHGVYTDDQGVLRLDEARVEARVKESMADPAEVARILEQMVRLREPRDVYIDGGCIDTTRECVRWVRPGTADLIVPEL